MILPKTLKILTVPVTVNAFPNTVSPGAKTTLRSSLNHRTANHPSSHMGSNNSPTANNLTVSNRTGNSSTANLTVTSRNTSQISTRMAALKSPRK